jgi:3-oxoacyl-[acyl-carrier-protein] synthase III
MDFKLSIDKITYVLPTKKQTVEDVASFSGISAHDLGQHLGFVEKYITTNEETSLDLAEKAVCKLMAASTVLPGAIDYIIYAHSGINENGYIRSPSAKIQALIKANNAFCFEITNGCNSLNAAFHIANNLLNNTNGKTNILIVVSDTLSKYIDFKNNVMHFYMYADGAAAILVNNYGNSNKLLSSSLHTDGEYADVAKVRYESKCVENTNGNGENVIIPVMETTISQESKLKLYDDLVSNYIRVIAECMSKWGLKSKDIKFFFLAQNSKRVLADVMHGLNFSAEKTLFTGRYLGHVGAIDSIIAFHNSLTSGNINPGDYFILAGTGVGFHWGAHLFQA